MTVPGPDLIDSCCICYLQIELRVHTQLLVLFMGHTPENCITRSRQSLISCLCSILWMNHTSCGETLILALRPSGLRHKDENPCHESYHH